MKLRLFGCAAAYVLAGTLCVSAQDAPDQKMKDRGSEVAPSPEGRASARDKGSSAQGRSESAQGKSERSDRGKNERAERKGDDQGDHTKSKAKSDSAAEKSDRKASKHTSKTTKQDQLDRDKSVREGRTDTGRAAESKQDGRTTDSAGMKRDQATDRTGDAGKNIQLSAEKRDRVQAGLRSDLKLKRETKVDVDISLGSRAPRHWAFSPVPATVIEIVPEYRGYVVDYVEDEYVICDPNTYEIVAVLPASGTDSVATTGRSTGETGREQCSTSLSLTQSEEKAILGEIQMDNEVNASGVTVGWSVPSNIELQTFPSSVLDQSDKLGGCRYFIVEDQVAIVDPDQDKVVLLIENQSK